MSDMSLVTLEVKTDVKMSANAVAKAASPRSCCMLGIMLSGTRDSGSRARAHSKEMPY